MLLLTGAPSDAQAMPQLIAKSSGHGGVRRGAGRRGYRAKVEDCRLRLDIRQVYPGVKLKLTWPEGPCFDVDVLSCALTITGSVGRDRLHQRVAIVETTCHFGGARSWFECSGCGARVAQLYFRERRFACRKCLRLVYASSYASRPSVRPKVGAAAPK